MSTERTVRLAGTIVAVVAVLGLYLNDLDRVPFHPDESSWLYMSGDFELVARGEVTSTIWQPDTPIDLDTAYRVLNAPLPKYVFGWARWVLSRSSARPKDWNWAQTWDENAQAGSVPDPATLVAARTASVAAAALSFGAYFYLGWMLGGPVVALLATVMLATHPLEMLHLRRAMAEATAQAGAIIAMLAICCLPLARRRSDQERWVVLIGMLCGLAIAAKQHNAPLVAVALVAVAVSRESLPASARVRQRILDRRMLTVLGGTILMFVALNPVMYRQPFEAAKLMVTARQFVAANQAADTGGFAGARSRIEALTAEMFFRPPSTEELTSYSTALTPMRLEYERRLLNRVWASSFTRWLFVGLAIVGSIAVFDRIKRHCRTATLDWLLVTWLAVQMTFTLIFVPIDWQRYYVPLLPPACILAALGAVSAARALLITVRGEITVSGGEPRSDQI